LSKRAAEAYGHIAGGERLSLTYQADVPAAESLGAVLEKTRSSDVRRGTTTRGPHRDELLIDVAGRPARNFGSQGQQKTGALALRIAELELVRERTGEYPVLMLDEVLSELDERRSRLLFDAIDPQVQCLITTATVTKHPALLGREDAVYRIERGILERQ
jgi:DNA replication and repair protein RecF